MLTLTHDPIEVGTLSQELSNHSAGALCAFEGRVRNNHLGREVVALEYEAANILAEKEFSKIVNEYTCSTPVLDVHCSHRLGRLELGEVAIWLGVLAPHRKEAFVACELIMSEIKKRLPIWKKEFFADGSTVWVDESCGCVIADK